MSKNSQVDLEQNQSKLSQEDDDGQECSNCTTVPENIIFLGCNHAICLKCVAHFIIEEQAETDSEIDFTEFGCKVCGEVTEFSKDIQQSLYELVDQQNGDAEEEEEEEEENSITDDSDSFLICKNHYGEQYTMYNSKSKSLYCNQCLLDARMERSDISFIKPLKKCLPEIFQNFQDLLNKANVCKNIIENKHKNYDILKENAKTQAQLVIRRFEIAADEFINRLQDQKTVLLNQLEDKSNEFIRKLEEREVNYTSSLDYFKNISTEINELHDNNENSEEEVLGYYFNNKQRIIKAIAEQQEETEDKEEKEMFEHFDVKIKEQFGNAFTQFFSESESKASGELLKISKKKKDKKPEQRELNTSQISSRMYESMHKLNLVREKPDFSRFLNQIRDQSVSKDERSLSQDLNNSRNMEQKSVKLKKSNFGIISQTNLVRQKMDKRDYNIRKKLEIDQKLRNFNVKGKRTFTNNAVRSQSKFRNTHDNFNAKFDSLQNKIKMRALKTKNMNVPKTCFNFY